MNQMHAKKADDGRIYLPYEEGRRRLMNLEKKYRKIMVGLHKYMREKNDIQIIAVLKYKQNKALHSLPNETEK